MHIDLRQLRHFIALAEHRSFVAAADAVCLSQSAFSRSIQALEHSAGCRLVDRASKELNPTKQGLIVLEHARRLVSGAHKLANEIALFNGLEAGELRFGAGPAPAAWLVPRAIAAFNGRYPKARVAFQVEHWQVLGKRLQAEDFEFFVADTRHFEANPEYRTLRLKPRKWHFCCRPGHPLAGQGQVSAAQLLSYPIATNLSPPNIRKVLVDLSGRPDFRPDIECENGHGLNAVVLASNAIGIASGPGQGAGEALVALTVAELPEDLEELHTRYGIVHRAGYSLSPLAEAMIGELRRIDEETV
ncbi:MULTISPECIES: LysR family transcriptional regulator [Pseudomonas]|jgi:DNA-binding transcriptional LysR family regulator|uniref:Transcriptional regulator n=1 Tax=Pseudomonas citronellolis TaxID=53408 RepID=A0A127MT82_9PSED|nr:MULTISPECIES: LysR family transcriptional regulator [Pseudomonas]AMO76476.1 HTH-type transcriptional regulator GbpR [Pseudomonas citronellolis]ANI15456.1 transcriptional regulator [Pseudomonas citronellolis]KES20980.1 transcriptional regulator [Pseudomonas sp. AAC]KRV66242.1 transcriptional regulator [Pseudomonas citronellolis]KRW78459.1 transcriptional regulator [Pseudomonas citronellolis]